MITKAASAEQAIETALHAPVKMADASAWLGEGLEPIRFDATPELRERSPDEAEMDRTDDGLVARRHLLEGAAPV